MIFAYFFDPFRILYSTPDSFGKILQFKSATSLENAQRVLVLKTEGSWNLSQKPITGLTNPEKP
jgi:hypothetical protein